MLAQPLAAALPGAAWVLVTSRLAQGNVQMGLPLKTVQKWQFIKNASGQLEMGNTLKGTQYSPGVQKQLRRLPVCGQTQ